MSGSTRGRAPSTPTTAPTAHHANTRTALHHANTPNGTQRQHVTGVQRERQRVTDIQRARMFTAMTEAAGEHGAANVTVAHVVECAGVSRRTFYEIFSDVEDCFLAAIDDGLARLVDRLAPVYRRPGSWRERVRASLEALLAFLEQEPHMGRLLVVETLAGGAQALARRQRVLDEAIRAIDEGRREVRRGGGPPPLTAEGVAGGVLGVLHSRLAQSGAQPLLDLAGPLMSMIVLPYLGPAAARRELERPVSPPPPETRGRAAPANPLQELGMRLTYRTVRVLMAIAAQPGASNRELALAAEVPDQGQISKLLTRLDKLGLIENVGAGHARGGPNAWTLTQRGAEVQRALTR